MHVRFASVILVLAAAVPATPQQPPATGEAMSVHPEAKKAIDGLWSPYCPGMMLEVCTSSGGAMLRDSAQSWAVQGLGADSIIERIVAEYGEEYRAEPRRSGAGLLAWMVPPVALVGGLGIVGVLLARRRAAAGSPPAEAPASLGSPGEEARLKAALKELDEEEEPVF
jgi:cytochrome c-type biogenesis protein CcmH